MWDTIYKMLKGRSVPVVDGDEPDRRLGRGTLTFGDNEQQSGQKETMHASVSDVSFEVVSTRTAVDQNDKKHVVYTVLVHPTNGTSISGENPPKSAVLERRYTDFLDLYSSLKQSHPLPYFPRKCLTGNFSASLIAERSQAFEKLLNEIASSPDLRVSDAVASFLCPSEDLNDPVLLENQFRALDATRGIQDRRHPLIIHSLLKLIVCLDSVGQGSMAELFAEETLRRLEVASDADVLRFYVPLLQLLARLRVDRGADIAHISTRLTELRCQGIETARGPNLQQMLANK